MAVTTYSWKDIADITFNATNLRDWVNTVSGVKYAATIQEFHPAGSIWPTPLDTGMRKQDPITIEFIYDGAAAAPALKCAMGTSSTLTITFATGMSLTGTFIVTEVEMGLKSDGDHTLTVTFTPTGTITWDLAA
jgi:hypothetical protein